MWQPILNFELKYHLRQPMAYVFSSLFTFLCLLFFLAPNNIALNSNDEVLNHNATYFIGQLLSAFGFFLIFPIAALCASSALKDSDYKMQDMIYSTPISKNSYFYNHFLSIILISLLIYLTVFFTALIGPFLGEFLGSLETDRLSEFNLQPYLHVLLLIVLPNIFILSSIMYSIAIISRNNFLIYSSIVFFIALYSFASSINNIELLAVSALLDPFGTTALESGTRYWTIFEKNLSNLPIANLLIINRLVWISIALAILIFAVKHSKLEPKLEKVKSVKKEPMTANIQFHEKPAAKQYFNQLTILQQYWSQTKLEVYAIIKNVGFLVILGMGIFAAVSTVSAGLGDIFGTPVYLTTGTIITNLFASFNLFFLIIIVYYAAELVNRERQLNTHEVVDSLPYPNGIMVTAKWSALVLVIFISLLIISATGILIQLSSGIYDINILLYAKGILVYSLLFVLISMIAIFMPTIVSNKYTSMFLVSLIFFMSLFASGFGFQHYLYRFGLPNVEYSDMNGYGHGIITRLWYFSYWFVFGLILLVITHLLWRRGNTNQWSERISLLKERLSSFTKAGLAVLAITFLGIGSFIFYNTNIINIYVSDKELATKQANYEKRFKQYELMIFPSVTDVTLSIDIFPEQRDIKLTGNYQLKNKTNEALTDFHLSFHSQVNINNIQLSNAKLKQSNKEYGYYIYQFNSPLQPNEKAELNFDIEWINDGFKNHNDTDSVLYNGTFFNSSDVAPSIGYNSSFQLTDNSERKQQGLPPVERAKPLKEDKLYSDNAFKLDAVNLDITLSTSQDQIAVAPGYLQKQWTKNNRQYFNYKSGRPVWNFYSVISADYEVLREQWNDIDIEIFYHASHDYNLNSMLTGIKDSLAYFSREFSPYQYKQVRILEFPGYRRFAQAFANTIPFSEVIGFTANLENEDDIDYAYYVTAHEIAHQWWGHQVISADAQGATLITETLSQYSALMVMEKKFGTDVIQRFLRFELDNYLSQRGSEQIQEEPLYKVENQQYIHYRKGSLVMYALRDYLGEETVNQILSQFIDQYAFKGAPYPTTLDLIRLIRQQTPAELQNMITDLFEKIVIYDFSLDDVTSEAMANGSYKTTLTVSTKKFEATGQGQEQEVPVNGWFDVALFGDEDEDTKLPKTLYIKKHLINSNKSIIEIISDKKPIKAGIDPYSKMIDRNPENNTRSI